MMARAQQSDRVRRVGVLMGADENDPEARAQFSEFMKELAELGWTDGRNLQIDIRRAGANADRARVYAKELVALEPDVLLAQTTGPTAALQQETKTIPIVFVGVSDPIGAAWLAGLSRPAGNYRATQPRCVNGRKVAATALGDCARHQTGRSNVSSRRQYSAERGIGLFIEFVCAHRYSIILYTRPAQKPSATPIRSLRRCCNVQEVPAFKSR
jgi:hypothetical protein